jgi:hypothetical protein
MHFHRTASGFLKHTARNRPNSWLCLYVRVSMCQNEPCMRYGGRTWYERLREWTEMLCKSGSKVGFAPFVRADKLCPAALWPPAPRLFLLRVLARRQHSGHRRPAGERDVGYLLRSIYRYTGGLMKREKETCQMCVSTVFGE